MTARSDSDCAGHAGEGRSRRVRRRQTVSLLGFVLAVAAVCTAVPIGFLRGEPVRPETGPIIFTQIPAQPATGSAQEPGVDADDLPAGSRIVLFDPSRPDASLTDLTAGFSAAGRPDLSFDGRRVLFVARRAPEDPLSVWELALDGGAPRRIAECLANCARATYASTIYTLDAEEAVDQIAFCAASDADDHSAGRHAALYTSRMDGSRVRQITFNPYGACNPLLLSDGRLLYASALPPDAGGGTALFTVNTDGTDVFVFADAHGPPAIRGMPCETDDGWVVYVESTANGPLGGGALVGVARTRSLHTRRVVAEAAAGSYHSPSALPDGRLLVSYRDAKGGTYGVYVLDRQRGTGIGKVYDAPDWEDVDAVAVRPRTVPAGRSSVVDERVEYGFLYCLDAYRTDLTPAGEIDDGEIATLRVFRGPDYRTGDALAGTTEETVLGEVPVHSDGSFYLQVPARTPLRLETVRSDGKLLQGMRNWLWVMPSERRGCIGCHADRELTPPNRHVLALREQPRKLGIDYEEARPTPHRPTRSGYRK